jgi:hypothetical protein
MSCLENNVFNELPFILVIDHTCNHWRELLQQKTHKEVHKQNNVLGHMDELYK